MDHFPLRLTYFLLQIVQWLKQNLQPSDSVWIGLSDRTTEGIWIWETGEQLSSAMATTWTGAEPNGQTSENCAVIQYYGGFVDLPCSNSKPFICEKIPSVEEYTCKMDQKWHAEPRQHSCNCKPISLCVARGLVHLMS